MGSTSHELLRLTGKEPGARAAAVLGEICDAMQVCLAIAQRYGYTEDEVITARRAKLADRGGFEEGYVLEYSSREHH